MKEVTLSFPDSFSIDKNEVSLLIASKLYEQGRLSLGQAAEVAGLSKRAFAEVLGRYGVSVINYPAEDIAKDVQNA